MEVGLRVGAACPHRFGLWINAGRDRPHQTSPQAPEWTDADRALLTATDELTRDAFITDATWNALGKYTDKQRMDLVMTVAQYTQVSMMLNSFGVQLDDDLALDQDLYQPQSA